jgi:hypothetical protein
MTGLPEIKVEVGNELAEGAEKPVFGPVCVPP